MSTALAQRQNLLPDASTWKTMLEMAGQLVESGLLPQAIKTPAAALAIIQKGLELQIPPMYALSNIGIINGKPVVGAEVMLAMIYRDHGDIAIQFDETSGERCSVVYKRRAWPAPRRFEWTLEDAKKAGLLDKGGVWKQYPAAMLRARCVSALARLAFPDSIGGMYTAEELGAEVAVTDEGEVVVVQPQTPVVTIVPKTGDVIEPTTIEEERAREMTGDGAVVTPLARLRQAEDSGEAFSRRVLDRWYARLAAIAKEREHPQAAKINAKKAVDLDYKVMVSSLKVLCGYFPDVPLATLDAEEPETEPAF